jgi:hypothetical protein
LYSNLNAAQPTVKKELFPIDSAHKAKPPGSIEHLTIASATSSALLHPASSLHPALHRFPYYCIVLCIQHGHFQHPFASLDRVDPAAFHQVGVKS